VYSTPARLNGEHLERKSRDEMYGKIKGRGTVAASSRCLHMGICSTSKIATALPRIASYLWARGNGEPSTRECD